MSLTAIIKANIDDFTANLDRAQARLDEFSQGVGQKLAKLGSTFQAVGGAISLGVTAPLTAAGVAAFNMAAEFEDALGATDQIFKDSASGVKDWADSLETYFGISKQEALEYSNVMGSMLVNIGKLTEDQAAKQGAKLIELAGDLTAMYGGRTKDAVYALTGALKGNNTMLDNYGMAVNEALIKTRALQLGLISQGEEMSLSAKQAATLSLIYEQTAAAQGQAAREADGASGSIRAFQTEIANLSTEIGSVLLPVVTPLISNLKEIVQAFRSLSPETQKMIVVIGAFAAALGPLLLGIGSVLKLAPLVGTAFATITGPIGIAVAAVSAAAVLIIKNWETIKEYFTSGNGAAFWTSISNNAQKLWNTLKPILTYIRDSFIYTWQQIDNNVISIVRDSFDTILTIISGTFDIIVGIVQTFAKLLRGDFSGALESVRNLFKNVFTSILNIARNTLSSISHLLSIFLKSIGADELGARLENWANGLVPVKNETQAVSEKVEESTTKITNQTAALNSNAEATKKAGKGVQDYRKELDQLLASWGIYESQIAVINTSFRDFNKLAKNAGASLAEFQTIASREWSEKAILSLDRILRNMDVDGFESPWTIDIPAQVKIDADFTKLNDKLTKLKSDLKGFIELDLQNLVGNSVSTMMSAVGDALAQGGNIIDAIGAGIIKSLGGLARSIGEQMIAFGVAGIALKKLMMNPYLALAAGAALVALGSFAQSSVSRQTSQFNGTNASANIGSQLTNDYSNWRGALYNNDKQVVELKLKNTELTGALELSNTRNKRLS
ncbi:TP901 family phage tail tape measure protein [Sphingobacterium allocomposti]|uniref:TP901 family phage tail tape measure protein n=1 Tax=Sphingobacterium allocomposti TaxID=415956 RepID=A0A5S5D061_9SPHI|nr:phage tail tape measure protein [Sphingobacterium composti Yoo et al. 2007 non Ten et al. 2007]TYP89427.1 TP901 family phage tail tape measure protein [Sphingobacterium composti Yoo et al. 2007 non Ten et al. 2007]